MRYLLIALCLVSSPAFAQTIGNSAVCFVPGPEDCAEVVAAEIAKTQHTIDMQAYDFTEPHIAPALIDAHERGVTVRLISDKTGPRERAGWRCGIAACATAASRPVSER